VKFGITLAQTAFNIAMIVFVALIVFIFSSTAVARTPSVEVVEAGVLDVDVLEKTPSIEMAVPMDDEIVRKTPSIDMGFYPIDWDPDRKSPLWNVFPQPLQDEIFEKTPSLEMAVPMDDEIVRKTPSIEMAVPLDDEIVDKNPSQAVREPLNVECCGPTMRFDLKEAAAAEILIYSVDGRLVRRLSEALPNGESSLTWDGRDDRGARAASGVYFARVQANEGNAKGKLVLIH
jgi:hypothetical protein